MRGGLNANANSNSTRTRLLNRIESAHSCPLACVRLCRLASKASKTNPNQMGSWNRFVFNRLKLINAPQFFVFSSSSSTIPQFFSLVFAVSFVTIHFVVVCYTLLFRFVNLFYIFKYFHCVCNVSISMRAFCYSLFLFFLRFSLFFSFCGGHIKIVNFRNKLSTELC